MDPFDFQRAWQAAGDELIRFPADQLQVPSIPEDTRQFLQLAGLPKEAAPYLSFEPGNLEWLKGSINLDQYFQIGTDSAGNPLALDTNGVVWLINHEMPSQVTLVNSSINALASSLLTYRDFVIEAIKDGGEDAFLDGRFPIHAINALSLSLHEVDNAAGAAGTFWSNELSSLVEQAGK